MVEIIVGIVIMILGEFLNDAGSKRDHEDGIILLDMQDNDSDQTME